MLTAIRSRLSDLSFRRGAVLLGALSLPVLGLEVAISHFAARSHTVPAQWIPVVLAPLAGFAIVAFVLAGHRWAGVVTRFFGGAVAFMGTLGTAFHLRGLGRLLEGGVDWESFVASLRVAPPPFAPGAFIGLGLLLWVLASPRLRLSWIGSRAATVPGAAAV